MAGVAMKRVKKEPNRRRRRRRVDDWNPKPCGATPLISSGNPSWGIHIEMNSTGRHNTDKIIDKQLYTNNNGWCCCCPKTSHTHTFTLWWCVFFSSRLLFCLVGVTFYYKKIITTNPFHYILFLSHKSQSHCEYCNWKWINCNKSSCLFWYFI